MTEIKRSSSVRSLDQRIRESDNKCVCQICTCGKHHCPQPHIPFKADTTNHHYYKPYQITAEQSRKCVYKVIDNHYDPDLIQSTYRTNYKGFQCPAAHLPHKYAYQPNTAKFYDQTEYNAKYVPNKIVVEGPTPCINQYRPNTGRFDGTTTYGTAFKAKKSEHDIPKKHYAYQQNKLPFYGNTTYGETYQPYQINAERPHTCQGKYTINPARFEGKSSYRDNYIAHPIHREQGCLIEQLPQRPRECSPGHNHIHFDAHQCNWK